MKSKMFFILLVTCLISCEKEVEPTLIDGQSVLVWEIVDEKIKKFKVRKEKECLDKIMEEAEAYVDSIIVNAINVGVLDSLQFPIKPDKPRYPDTIILDTILPVKIEF